MDDVSPVGVAHLALGEGDLTPFPSLCFPGPLVLLEDVEQVRLARRWTSNGLNLEPSL